MFGFFKKITEDKKVTANPERKLTTNPDREVTTNPEILFNSDVATSELKVHGLKLEDKADLIPLDQVSTTTFEKYPDDCLRFSNGVVRTTCRNNKTFYESTNGEKEYLLTDRIKSVLELGGILHMKSGAKYVIRNKTIIGIGIHQDILTPYRKISKNKIEKIFGKASRVDEDYEQTDGELWNTIYFYEDRNMIVNFFEPDNEIILINIGIFPYSKEWQE